MMFLISKKAFWACSLMVAFGFGDLEAQDKEKFKEFEKKVVASERWVERVDKKSGSAFKVKDQCVLRAGSAFGVFDVDRKGRLVLEYKTGGYSGVGKRCADEDLFLAEIDDVKAWPDGRDFVARVLADIRKRERLKDKKAPFDVKYLVEEDVAKVLVSREPTIEGSGNFLAGQSCKMGKGAKVKFLFYETKKTVAVEYQSNAVGAVGKGSCVDNDTLVVGLRNARRWRDK